MGPVAVRARAAVRREIARRAAAGEDDAAMAMERVTAALEADPADRAALAEAERATRAADAPEGGEHPLGARADRERRALAAHRAIGELMLAGELVPDGPGRVALPGFGRSTWRAIALLRDGAGGPPGRWAAAVAAEPAADLGDDAPAFLRGLRPPPELAGAARRLLGLEALRQDARSALLTATASMGAALDAGDARAAESARADCDELEARIRALDEAIDRAWDEGLRRAAAGAGR